tara:strand:- start:198 stop:668 length:471 start_codon:yes stop_codon:yes gene_type:complete
MNNKYINFYNNLVSLTRNKILYEKFTSNDTFSQRLTILMFHFAFFLRNFKEPEHTKILQDVYDYTFKQLEYSIREEGFGDVTINKKMKTYINTFHSILEKIENWNDFNSEQKKTIIFSYLDLDNSIDSKIVDYFENYRIFLTKNSLNSLLKGVSKP